MAKVVVKRCLWLSWIVCLNVVVAVPAVVVFNVVVIVVVYSRKFV